MRPLLIEMPDLRVAQFYFLSNGKFLNGGKFPPLPVKWLKVVKNWAKEKARPPHGLGADRARQVARRSN